jgi:hypothetical protein
MKRLVGSKGVAYDASTRSPNPASPSTDRLQFDSKLDSGQHLWGKLRRQCPNKSEAQEDLISPAPSGTTCQLQSQHEQEADAMAGEREQPGESPKRPDDPASSPPKPNAVVLGRRRLALAFLVHTRGVHRRAGRTRSDVRCTSLRRSRCGRSQKAAVRGPPQETAEPAQVSPPGNPRVRTEQSGAELGDVCGSVVAVGKFPPTGPELS